MDRTSNQRSPGLVDFYVAAVAVVAIALTLIVSTNGGALVPHGQETYVLIFCALLFLGESRPKFLRFVDAGQVTPGWAFAFSIVLLGAPVVAVAAMAACTLYLDLRDRKSLTKIIFNTSQISASLAAGALLLQWFGLRGPITDVDHLSTHWAVGIVVAGGLVFIANGVMTGLVLALHYKTSVRSTMGRSFFLSISADGALLSLSPIFVVAIHFSLMMLPLLGFTALLVYQSTQQALARAHEASHDGLTQLLNRRSFDTHLAGFLESNAEEVRGALLLMDLDGFKEINDRLGHQTGDMMLLAIADQLTRSAPANAVVARVGGDEFAVLIPGVASEASTMAIVERLRTDITRPVVVNGFALSVGVSIGLAFAPTHGRIPEDLLSAADVAMYRAKRYRTGVECYKTLGSRPERGRLGLLGELSQAIGGDQLKIHYQPLIRFRDDTPDAMEALLRWQHPTLGQVPPADFITLAEHTDLIASLTQFVLTQATIDARAVGRFNMRLSMNVSARNMQDRRFPSSVFKALSEVELDPKRLELEITESAIAREPERSQFAITALREAGVRVAIDDFGTGYSSFGMLRDITVDRLKIDASFVKGIATSQRQQHLVRAIVSLASSLGIETVAEGIETEDTWTTLAKLGCDVAQGYLICRPMPLLELVDWLDVRQTMSALERVSS